MGPDPDPKQQNYGSGLQICNTDRDHEKRLIFERDFLKKERNVGVSSLDPEIIGTDPDPRILNLERESRTGLG